MTMNTVEVMNRGMECLVENLGMIEAEHFISVIIREKFDYTKWQREHFDKIPAEQLHEKAIQYAKEHPYKGKAKVLIE